MHPAASSKPLIQQYLDQYINDDANFVYQPFHPSFNFIAEVIRRQVCPFSLRELELLIILCQQVKITNTAEYYATLKQVHEWRATTCSESLFENMKLEMWEEEDSYVDTFWAFYPLNELKCLNPVCTAKKIFSNHPDMYKKFISAVHGNKLTIHKLLNRQRCYFGLCEELEKVCQTIPLKAVQEKQRYPYTLIQLSTLPPSDPREFVLAFKTSEYVKQDFENYLFGMDWYASALVLTWSREILEELKDSHYAVYLWTRKELSRNRSERDDLNREAFNHGLMHVGCQLNGKV